MSERQPPANADDYTPVVELDEKEAHAFASLCGIAHDLQFAIDAVTVMAKRLDQSPKNLQDIPDEDYIQMESLWTAALVAYCRCFATGRRERLKPSMFADFKEGASKGHEFFQNLRNQKTTHQTYKFERIGVGLILKPKDGPDRGPYGISYLHLGRSVEPRENLKALWELATLAKQSVDKRTAEEYDSLLAYAQSLPIDDLYARKELQITRSHGTDKFRVRVDLYPIDDEDKGKDEGTKRTVSKRIRGL